MATTKAASGKKGLINFDFLQKLGKVLMTVIAVMPAAGLMISLGKLVQMGGGDIAAVMTIGTTMENIGWAVINNLHILFAVAIGGSWAKERAGGAFAAVLAFALINAGRPQCCDPHPVRAGDRRQRLLYLRAGCSGPEHGRVRGHHRRFCGRCGLQ